jgi:hypothetical protein
MDQNSKPIRVGVIGMDQRMRNALRLFFQGPCKNRCIMVEDESAETVIIDLDAYQGEELYIGYRQRHPDHPLILLSLHESKYENEIFLAKPLNAKALLSALNTVTNQIQSTLQQADQGIASKSAGMAQTADVDSSLDCPTEATTEQHRRKKTKSGTPLTHHAAMYLGEQNAKVLIGTAPDIDPRDPQQLANAQYDPSVFLQSHFARACSMADQHHQCVRMETPRGSIIVLPHTQQVYLNLKDSQLRPLAVVPVVEGSLDYSLDKDASEHIEKDDYFTTSREALLWKTALWASRGRVPTGTQLDIPAFLRRWPNLTRLLLFPHALRIAALWADQPHSLLATAQSLAIPQRHVFSFYSATNALGLSSTSRRRSDTLLGPAPLPKNKRHGLFSRILSRLRRD